MHGPQEGLAEEANFWSHIFEVREDVLASSRLTLC